MSILRNRTWKLLVICTLGILGLIILLYNSTLKPSGLCPCDRSKKQRHHHARLPEDPSGSGAAEEHKLCVLVPFRDRFDELLAFVPHLSRFLLDQSVEHTIYVLNQVDSYRFNRASLLNAGFAHTLEVDSCDYVALHDVDLQPANSNLKYAFPESGKPLHLSPPGLHPKYDYPNFIGGIMLLRREDYKKLNGMSNRYWGWGLEDDEFFARIRDAGMSITRPIGIDTGTARTFRHYHSASKRGRARDYRKCYNQRDVTRRRDRETGLDNVRYDVKGFTELTVEGYPATLLRISLECDRTKTPWCDCKGSPDKEDPLLPMEIKDNILPYLPKKQ